jgi:D-tyrosyl-tRNA(Tyr) deacylase
MRAVIQRVSKASVSISPVYFEEIGPGLLVLLGVEENDTPDEAVWLANKILNLRIFGDANGLMNLSIQDVKGEIMIISQFTLHASTRKGNRPSFIRAASPEFAQMLYNNFIELIRAGIRNSVKSGIFGEHMDIALINSGPVTIIVDTKLKE